MTEVEQTQVVPWTHKRQPTSHPHGRAMGCLLYIFNTLRLRQNGRHFADNTFKRIFLNENVRISIKISLTFVTKGPINDNLALVQIMAWRRSGDKPLSEPMMVSLLTYIDVTRPQWVKRKYNSTAVSVDKELKSWLYLLTHDWDETWLLCVLWLLYWDPRVDKTWLPILWFPCADYYQEITVL